MGAVGEVTEILKSEEDVGQRQQVWHLFADLRAEKLFMETCHTSRDKIVHFLNLLLPTCSTQLNSTSTIAQ